MTTPFPNEPISPLHAACAGGLFYGPASLARARGWADEVAILVLPPRLSYELRSERRDEDQNDRRRMAFNARPCQLVSHKAPLTFAGHVPAANVSFRPPIGVYSTGPMPAWLHT
jgi:hypothetical protein